MPFPTLSRIGLAGLALTATPALAADFDGPYGPPRGPVPGYEAPPHRHRFTGEGFGPREGGCRTFVRRRYDEDGEPVLRRVRICDERPAFGPRHGPEGFDGPPPARPWDGPRW